MHNEKVGEYQPFHYILDKYKLMNIKNEQLIVLPYKKNSSQGNEIKLSLNGWKKFCQFNYHFVVIGDFDYSLIDEFSWVEFIYCEMTPELEGQYNPHLDVQNKLKIISEKYGNDYEGFIRISDDEYAIKPFELKDIIETHYHAPHFHGKKNHNTNFWKYDKWKTRQLLDKENLPHINYTTHYPYYFEFKKLKEIQAKFNMLEESYVLEDVYFNYFPHEEPILDSEIRFGIWNCGLFKIGFQKAIDNPNIKFICNSVNGWSQELEDELWKIVK